MIEAHRIEFLHGVEFFAGLDRQILEQVAENTITSSIRKNEPILRQGDSGSGLYIVVRGRFAAPLLRRGEIGPGDTFGETSLLDSEPPTHIVAMEDSECLFLSRAAFEKLMKQHPELSIRLARALAVRIRAMETVPSPVPTPKPTTGKAAVEQQLLDTFKYFYAVKALTRFSVAMLGCPAEASGAGVAEQIRVGEVKVIFCETACPEPLRIDAVGAGVFNLHLFRPEWPEPVRVGPTEIQMGDRFEVDLKRGTLSALQPERPSGRQSS